MSTLTQTLAALNNVGKAPVSLGLDVELFSTILVRRCASRHPQAFSIADDGQVQLLLVGDQAWQVLRDFAADLLAGAQETE